MVSDSGRSSACTNFGMLFRFCRFSPFAEEGFTCLDHSMMSKKKTWEGLQLLGFCREGPEKAPTYIGFYREGPEKAPSNIEKAPRRPRLTLFFTGKAPLTPFGFYQSKWRRIAFELAFELEKLIVPRCVTCAIVSVVAWVSLKRGGSGFVWDAPTCFEETWRLWLNHFWLQKTYAIGQTCWSTPPVQLYLVCYLAFRCFARFTLLKKATRALTTAYWTKKRSKLSNSNRMSDKVEPLKRASFQPCKIDMIL